MSSDKIEALAAEYALGTLRGDARRDAQARFDSDPAFADLVETWERRLEGLESGEELEPPASLWGRIDAALEDSASAPGTRTLRHNEGSWQTVRPGIEKKVLDIDRSAGMHSYLLRIAPGALIPAHAHAKTEECLVIEGDVVFGGTVLQAGDYHVAPAGIGHPDITSRNGGLLFLRGAFAA